MNSNEIFTYTAKFDEVVKKESYFENLLSQEFSTEILMAVSYTHLTLPTIYSV